MKALVLDKAGESPTLILEDREIPNIEPREVLIKVHACGFCYHDVLVMQGVLRRGVKEKVVLGHEISGIVASVGTEINQFQEGDKVASIFTQPCGHCQFCTSSMEQRCVNGIGIGHRSDGGFAEYVKLHENALVKLSETVDLDAASIYGCPIGVAYNAIKYVAKLKPGEKALVTGAGGGHGVHSIQIARSIGATVFAVTGSPSKADQLTEIGAQEILLAQDDLDYSEIVMALTEDQGVNVVIENVTGAAFQSSLNSMSQFGRMVIVGDIGGGSIRLNSAELIFRDAHIMGAGGATRKQLQEVAELVEQNQLQPIISTTYPLEEALDAYRYIKEQRPLGRVILKP